MGDVTTKYFVATGYDGRARAQKRPEELPLITTVRAEREGAFVTLEVFSRGMQCGRLTVPQGDAVFIASRLFKGEYEEFTP